MIAYTSSRPGALVEASCAAGTNECLTYNDIRLLVIPNPSEPLRNVIVIEVTLLYTKGNRQTKKPYVNRGVRRLSRLTLLDTLALASLCIVCLVAWKEQGRTRNTLQLGLSAVVIAKSGTCVVYTNLSWSL